MAKKDFDKYYAQHYQSYLSAINALTEWGAEAQNNMVSEEQIQQAKEVLSPIIEAQRFLDYVKFLLDKPSRSKKAKKYEKQNKKLKDSEFNSTTLSSKEKQIIDIFNKR